VVIFLVTGPKVRRFIAEDDEFLRVIKIRSTTTFRGEVNPSVLVVRFYGMLNNPTL
jgi:hypothetical protein